MAVNVYNFTTGKQLEKTKKANIRDITKGIGTLVNDISGTTANNEFSAEQAEIQRNYEKDMSNTAYQRATADMQAAGLNPALLYGSGTAATTPAGSTASAVANAGGLQGIASVVSSASQVLNAKTNAYNSKLNAGKLVVSALRALASLG